MTSISAAAATRTAMASTATAGTNTSASLNNFDKDTFLKLLVAQLKYQDPTKPTDTSEFMSQTAQFTLVEKFEALVDSNNQLMASQKMQEAISLVGKSVTWINELGESQSGDVSSVSVSGGLPSLNVGSFTVTLDAITEVQLSQG